MARRLPWALIDESERECAYPSKVPLLRPQIPLGGKCGLSDAVMRLASLTLGQIAKRGLMLSGGDVTVHLKEEWE